MYIKSLEIENFKSVNKKETITFDKGINVIMGANGTGKSNILDSIYFVFGKKDKRVEKNTNFFNKNNKSGKSAVKITADNNKTFERILVQYASGYTRSKYYINEKISTKQEVAKYLKQISTKTMDDVDTRMNIKEAENFVKELKKQAKHTQIIVISHKKSTIESADKVIKL